MNGRFATERSPYERLAEREQRPAILVIGCVDSRVSPEVVFNSEPGGLLVASNVANLVPPYEPKSETQHGTSAALEFAVQALRIKHIVVLGHAHCGGIHAFAHDREPLSPGDFIGRWMSQVAPAAAGLGPHSQDDAGYLHRLEFAAVEVSLKNLMTFPFIRLRVEQCKLHLHGAYFGIASGHLLVLDPETGRFVSPAENSGGPTSTENAAAAGSNSALLASGQPT